MISASLNIIIRERGGVRTERDCCCLCPVDWTHYRLDSPDWPDSSHSEPQLGNSHKQDSAQEISWKIEFNIERSRREY